MITGAARGSSTQRRICIPRMLMLFFFLMIRRPPRSTLFPYNDALPISINARDVLRRAGRPAVRRAARSLRPFIGSRRKQRGRRLRVAQRRVAQRVHRAGAASDQLHRPALPRPAGGGGHPRRVDRHADDDPARRVRRELAQVGGPQRQPDRSRVGPAKPHRRGGPPRRRRTPGITARAGAQRTALTAAPIPPFLTAGLSSTPPLRTAAPCSETTIS